MPKPRRPHLIHEKTRRAEFDRFETVLEKVARSIEPETFLLPRINLYKANYDRAFAKARAAIDAYVTAYRAGTDTKDFP